MRSKINFARQLRKADTSAEGELWKALRGRRFEGWKFRRQQPIGKFVADFCCLQAKLTIELDGKQHESQKDYDRERRDVLELFGFQELRFANSDVIERLDWVLTEIGRALDSARAEEMRKVFPRFE